jgi:hypothetical protein
MKRAVWYRGIPPDRDDALFYAVCSCRQGPEPGQPVALTEEALAWCLGYREVGPRGPRRFFLLHAVPHRSAHPGTGLPWYGPPRRRRIVDGDGLHTGRADGSVARSNRSGYQPIQVRRLPIVVECQDCGEAVLIDWNDAAPLLEYGRLSAGE